MGLETPDKLSLVQFYVSKMNVLTLDAQIVRGVKVVSDVGGPGSRSPFTDCNLPETVEGPGCPGTSTKTRAFHGVFTSHFLRREPPEAGRVGGRAPFSRPEVQKGLGTPDDVFSKTPICLCLNSFIPSSTVDFLRL